MGCPAVGVLLDSTVDFGESPGGFPWGANPVHNVAAAKWHMQRADLVVASSFLPSATRSALDRLGIAVVTLGIATDVEGNLEQVRDLADAVGEPQEGAELVTRIEAALAAAAAAMRTCAIASQRLRAQHDCSCIRCRRWRGAGPCSRPTCTPVFSPSGHVS